MIYFSIAFIVFFLAFLLSRHLTNPASSLYIPDHPNHRSLHAESRPRNGGIAILSGFFLGWVIVWFEGDAHVDDGKFLLFGLIQTSIVSLLDDKYSIGVRLRLFFHACAALVLIVGGGALNDLLVPGIGKIELGWFSLPFSALFVVWMMNLYNFMDGMDGFAGGMGVFGFGFLALFGWMAGKTFFFVTALSISTASLGFLTQNFPAPHSRIFMGDVGSVSLGFLAASLSLWGVRDGIFDFFVPVLIFSPFIVDATVTMMRRYFLGKDFWQSHHSHYYQRLVRSGWNHKKTVLYEYVLMLGSGSVAVFLHTASSELAKMFGLFCCVFVYVLLIVLVDRITKNVVFD